MKSIIFEDNNPPPPSHFCLEVINVTCKACFQLANTSWCPSSSSCLSSSTYEAYVDCSHKCDHLASIDTTCTDTRNLNFLSLVISFVFLVVLPLCAIAACAYFVAIKIFGESKVRPEEVVVEASPMPVHVNIHQIVPINDPGIPNDPVHVPVILDQQYVQQVNLSDQAETDPEALTSPITSEVRILNQVTYQPLVVESLSARPSENVQESTNSRSRRIEIVAEPYIP